VTNDKADLNPVTALYRDLLSQLDTWFAEASDRNSGVVPCRSGCSACCHGPFDISVADALLIREAFLQLPDTERAEVRRKAQVLVAKMMEIEPAWKLEEGLEGISEESFDRICEALAREPCPLLGEEGDCRIYPDRPMVCRMMGLGIVTPSGRVIENSCPIAGNFPEYAALQDQPLDLEALEETELACLEAASVTLFGTPERSHFETTIAVHLSIH
jgi:Fe-S-cluster containining protein